MKDIATDGDNDLLWKNGDIDWVDSENSNLEDLVDAAPNEYKQFPFLGYNVKKYLHGAVDLQAARRDLRLALESDNWSPETLTAFIDPNGLFQIGITAKIG